MAIEPPISAIALDRCSSPTRSLMAAVIVELMAPAPWRNRPMISIVMSSATAQSTEPTANSNSPIRMTGLRPIRSLSRPNGYCKNICTSA